MGRSNRISKLIRLIFFILVTTSTNLYAETFYVGDTLRVGIRPEPVNGGPSIAVVSSGTALEILDRQGPHVKIRSPSGVEGWVKGAYLTKSKPSQILLTEAISKIKRLEKDITALKTQKGGQSGTSIDIAKLEAEKSALQQEVENLRSSLNNNDDDLGTSLSFMEITQTNLTPLYFLLGGLIFILSLGFLFGVTWHKHQVTKRLGGLSL